jgi:hypothetical protein
MDEALENFRKSQEKQQREQWEEYQQNIGKPKD